VTYYLVPGYIEPEKLRIYGNPLQPEFSSNRWPFTYPWHSSPEAEESWSTAPKAEDGVPIWVMHSPLLGRLDKTNVVDLSGCAAQAERIAASRSRLCVSAQFYYSWGLERVKWVKEGHGIAKAQILTL